MAIDESCGTDRTAGLIGALRQLRDPLLLVAFPITFAAPEHRPRLPELVADRLRLPRDALGACPRAPRRRADLSRSRRATTSSSATPRSTRPSSSSRRCRSRCSPSARVVALVLPARRLRVRVRCGSSACATGAATSSRSRSPVVVHGLFYGNLTIAPRPAGRDRVALPRACRDRGLALGAAVAAKLFVWPLVVWLLLTRRFRAAAWAAGSAVVLVLGAWALIGFEGLRDYPTLLRAVQDVYAVRSLSVSTVAGAPRRARRRRRRDRRRVAGIALHRVAAWLARRTDGDRRAFALRRRRVHRRVADRLAELRGAALRPDRGDVAAARAGLVLRVRDLALGAHRAEARGRDVCCRPADVPEQAWAWSHVESTIWLAAALMSLVVLVSIFTVRADRARDRWTG